MKLHGQARSIPDSTTKSAGLPVERNPAPKTISHPLANLWSSGARIKSELQQTGIVLGGLLMILLVYLVVSGTVLAMFYNTRPEEAYQSVVAISSGPVTSFIRNFHYWSSDLLIFILFLHMTRVALTKPSGAPRRYAWWVGAGLLLMVGAEMLIGTFLRGDQEALEAYSHFFIGTNAIVAKYVPQVGILIDFFSDRAALFRFFIFHSVVIPFGILSLIVLHGLFAPTFRAMLAPWKKISDAAIRGSLRPEGFFSSPSVRKIGVMAGLSLAVISSLSLALPAPLLSSPYGGVEVTKPPWWLLWVVAAENTWGLAAVVILPPILFLLFAAIPLFSKNRPGADLGVYIYLVTIVILVAVSFWASQAGQVAHTEQFIQQHHGGAH